MAKVPRSGARAAAKERKGAAPILGRRSPRKPAVAAAKPQDGAPPGPAGGDPGPLQRGLLAWFRRAGRDLPWRRVRDPYRTWVSEVMLQQTQVDRVVDYFHRFLERFPDVASLAAAPEADLLRLWEGLGYYRRARQLQAAARRIVADHGGHLPDSVDALRALPGVGRYTAGAIASIAFDLPEPIVEANSRRVLARLAGHEAAIGGAAGDGPIWAIAADWLPADAASDWNQALMDLGATICTPRSPLCTRCPVADHCIAHRTGRTGSIPRAAPRRKVVELEETALVVRRGTKVLLVRRRPGEWWEGLWDFPRSPAAELLAPLGCGRPRIVGRCAYSVTHHRVAVIVKACTASVTGPRRPEARWIEWGKLGTIAMAAPGRRIAAIAAASEG